MTILYQKVIIYCIIIFIIIRETMFNSWKKNFESLYTSCPKILINKVTGFMSEKEFVTNNHYIVSFLYLITKKDDKLTTAFVFPVFTAGLYKISYWPNNINDIEYDLGIIRVLFIYSKNLEYHLNGINIAFSMHNKKLEEYLFCDTYEYITYEKLINFVYL